MKKATGDGLRPTFRARAARPAPVKLLAAVLAAEGQAGAAAGR